MRRKKYKPRKKSEVIRVPKKVADKIKEYAEENKLSQVDAINELVIVNKQPKTNKKRENLLDISQYIDI